MGGAGFQGRRAPASRTPSRGHTGTHRDPQRHMSPGKPVTDSEPGFLLGAGPEGPSGGRHSIQPQGEGCERRHSREAWGAPISGGAGGPADTPAPGRQPRASPARGPLGGRQSGPLGGPLSSQNPLKITSKSSTLSNYTVKIQDVIEHVFLKSVCFLNNCFNIVRRNSQVLGNSFQ